MCGACFVASVELVCVGTLFRLSFQPRPGVLWLVFSLPSLRRLHLCCRFRGDLGGRDGRKMSLSQYRPKAVASGRPPHLPSQLGGCLSLGAEGKSELLCFQWKSGRSGEKNDCPFGDD